MRLFRIFFGIYALVVFLVSLLVVIPAYVIIFNFCSKARAPHVAHKVSRGWAAFLMFAFFIRLKLEGRSKIDPNQTYVFISNHQSQLDIPAFACTCSNSFRFLAKAELVKIPLLGYIIKNLYITVKRGDKNDRGKSIDAMKRSIDEGVSVFICPEGTRNRSDKPLLDLRDGAFRLAVQAQVPLAVLTLKNSKDLNSPNKMLQLSPGTINAVWSDPIDTRGMRQEDVPALKERARQLMLQHLS